MNPESTPLTAAEDRETVCPHRRCSNLNSPPASDSPTPLPPRPERMSISRRECVFTHLTPNEMVDEEQRSKPTARVSKDGKVPIVYSDDAPLGLSIKNSILSRSLRRKTLATAVKNVEWSRSVGGSNLAQKLRLRERVLTFRCLHLVFTMAVMQHFFYNKYTEKLAAVPLAATNYNWKLMVPSVEFGFMHGILFQLALIPLTVSRSLLAWIATKTSALPLEHIMTLHIHIGYAFCSVVVIATLVFLLFFGKLCHDYNNGTEKVNMCLKFQTEIMATGLVLFGLCAIVLVSSYLRGRMKFEVFYSLHIVAVGAIYAGAMIHTLDDEFRKGSKVGANRSQSFRWITGSIAIFLADRTWRYLTQESEVPVLRSHCHSDGGSVTLQILKPWWFSFLPGQYLHLQVSAINPMWHPFSIASAPESNFLTLIIQVSPKQGEWTSKVAAMVRNGTLVRVNLRGPFGSSVGPQANSPAAANIIAVGSGTGIVPMISLLKERADQLGLLSAAGLSRTQSTLAQRQLKANQAYCLGQNVTHRTNESFRHFQLKYRAARLAAFEAGKGPMPVFLKRATSSAGSYSGVVFAILAMTWVCTEGAAAALVLSWSNLDQRAYMAPAMVAALEVITIALIVPYMVVVMSWICCRSRAEHEASLLLHILAVITMVGVTASFIAAHKFESLTAIEQAVLVVFSVWRVGAAWSYRCTTSRNTHGYASSNPVESFRMLWATRSAELVIGVLEDLEKTFKDLEASMNTGSTEIVGTEGFPQLEIHVYCTDRNPRHVTALKTWLRGTRFENLVTFARAELGTELVTSMRRHVMAPSFMNRLPGEKKTCAVTYCGSPGVSDALFRAVRRCGQLAAVAGAADFEFTFRTENYSNMPKVREIAQDASSTLIICPVKPMAKRRLSQRDKEEIKANEWNTMRHFLVDDSIPIKTIGAKPGRMSQEMEWDDPIADASVNQRCTVKESSC